MADQNKIILNIQIILILILSCSSFSNCYSETETDILQQGVEFKDGDQLVSTNQAFALKFFSFGSSMNPYLGILNDNYPSNKVVWVANRDNPIPDTSGKLLINSHGRLSITYSGGIVVDLFKPAVPVEINANAVLLDSGNFVLNELYPDTGFVKQVLWQSSDYPHDTLLPGMKLGIDLTTGHKWSLTSWASDSLPATGSFKLTRDPNGSSQLVMLSRGNIFWTSGQWRDGQFENTDLLSSGPDVPLYYTSDEAGKYLPYLTITYDTRPALTIYPDAQLKGTTLNMNVYCIRSFQSEGYRGCVEYKRENSECRATDGWSSQVQVETYADGYEYEKSYYLTLDDCWKICWNNFSCTAYTYTRENRMVYFIPRWYSYNGDAGKNRRLWIWLIIVMGLFAPLSLCYVVGKRLHIRGLVVRRRTRRQGQMVESG